MEKLVAKRKQLDDKKVLEAYHSGNKTAEGIFEFMSKPAEPDVHAQAVQHTEQALPAEFVAKFDHYTINMTSKEAKRSFLKPMSFI